MSLSTASNIDFDDGDSFYDDEIFLIDDLHSSDVSEAGFYYTSTPSDAYMQEVVIDTCTKVQMFMLLVIIVAVSVALYKFLRIFF